MVELVENNLSKIIDACKEHQVESLYLFGSAARAEDFDGDSDVDFLYEFKKGIPVSVYADNYFNLKICLNERLIWCRLGSQKINTSYKALKQTK